MQEALERVRDEFGQEYLLTIDGKGEESGKTMASANPSNKSEELGRVVLATEDHAVEAISAARNAFSTWSKVETQHRTEYVELIAAEMRNRRFDLASWIVFECGKPWAEADADVAEAIDFCMYYAQQMRLLDEPQQNRFSR